MKRGQRAPWKVVYVWEDTGTKGKVACADEWTARHKADDIRHAAVMQGGRQVSVTVRHEP